MTSLALSFSLLGARNISECEDLDASKTIVADPIRCSSLLVSMLTGCFRSNMEKTMAGFSTFTCLRLQEADFFPYFRGDINKILPSIPTVRQ